jgi:hypothetical protein
VKDLIAKTFIAFLAEEKANVGGDDWVVVVREGELAAAGVYEGRTNEGEIPRR